MCRYFALQLLELLGEFLIGDPQLTQVNKSVYHADAHFDGSRAVDHRGGHNRAALGKGGKRGSNRSGTMREAVPGFGISVIRDRPLTSKPESPDEQQLRAETTNLDLAHKTSNWLTAPSLWHSQSA